MKETPKVHYTSRDYNSIYNDLIASIPALTDLWTGREDSDPGIVLTKLMASSGDMLHFNMDKQSLEFYRSTVTQRKNMRRILDLIHYKMHWYKSAILNLTITNNTLDTVQLATSISKADADYITQRVYNQYNALPPYLILPFQKNWQGVGTLSIEPGGTVEVEAVQGILNNITFSVDDVINNRYYLPTSLIDQDHMWLEHLVVNATGQLESDLSCWELVPDLNVQVDIGRYFQFDVDEFDQPFIELVPYWQRKDYATPGKGEYFKLYYVETMANLGNVGKNVFSYSGRISNSVGGTILVDGLDVPKLLIEHSDNNTYSVTNSDAPGQDIETVEEAYAKSSLWINTYDTLVTIKDFEDYVKAYGDMSDCKTIDPQRAFEINQLIQKDTSLSDNIFDSEGNLVENSKFKKFLCLLNNVMSGEQQKVNYENSVYLDTLIGGKPFSTISSGWYNETQNLATSRYVYTYLDITETLKNKDSKVLDDVLDIVCNIPEIKVESVNTDTFGNVSVQELVMGSTYLYYGTGTEGMLPWEDSTMLSYILDDNRIATITGILDENEEFVGRAYFVIKLDSFAILSTQFSSTISSGTEGSADTFTLDENLLNYILQSGGTEQNVPNATPIITVRTNTDLLNSRLKQLPNYSPYTTKLFAIYNDFNAFNTGSRTYLVNTPAFVLPTGHHVCQVKNKPDNSGVTITWVPCDEDDMDTPYQRLEVYKQGDLTVLNGVTYIKAPEVDSEGKEYMYTDEVLSDDGYIIDTDIKIFDKEGNDVTSNYPKKFKEYSISLLADNNGAINTEVPDAIISQMNSNKSITCDVSFGTIRVFDWVAKGTIYLQEPVDIVTANEILVAVTNNLRETFSPSNIGIGNKIAYMDIVEAVKATDTRIRFFDPDMDLKYVDTNIFDINYFNDVSVWNYVDTPDNSLKYTNGYLRIASESLK